MTQAAPEDPLEGVTARTTKSELFDRLGRAGKKIARLQAKDLSRTKDIEDRVREKWASRQRSDLFQIIVQGTEEEAKEAAEFIADLSDEQGSVAPHMLQRLAVGIEALMREGKDAS